MSDGYPIGANLKNIVNKGTHVKGHPGRRDTLQEMGIVFDPFKVRMWEGGELEQSALTESQTLD